METLLDRRTITPGAIYCVGKNYPEHAREMQLLEGSSSKALLEPAVEPIIFMKPPTALETEGVIAFPSFHGSPLSCDMHYEAEIVLLVGRSTDGCSIEDAPQYIGGFGAGLDMQRTMAGTRKAPSQFEFFSLRKDVVPPSGQEFWCGPLSVLYMNKVSFAMPSSSSSASTRPTALSWSIITS